MGKAGILSVCFIVCMLIFSACKDDEGDTPDGFTGRETRYELLSGSDFNFHGEALFEEKTNGSTRITIKLEGVHSSSEVYLPVHLHHGPVEQEAAMAAMLEPVNSRTGESITHLQYLMDDSAISYEELLDFDGHIKVHLGESGEDKEVILAYGNIGRNH